MRHVKAFTYQPKIPAVRSGLITQTIRPGLKVSEGDEILFPGWTGRPYRSPWNWRLRVTVSYIRAIIVWPTCYQYHAGMINGLPHTKTVEWDKLEATRLAERDGIDPPTGAELGRVLCAMHSKGARGGAVYQIIRWDEP